MNKGFRARTSVHSRIRGRWANAGAARPAVEGLEPRMLLAGNGLAAVYYDNANFTGTSVARVDPQVNFNWGSGSPATGLGVNTFSARWTGQVLAPVSGTYRFYTRTDDGARLWVNGQLLVNAWKNQSATEYSGQINLQAGQRYDIQMDYYENTGTAVAQLRWSGPGFSKQAIPQASLYSTSLPAAPTQLIATLLPNGIALNWLDNAANEAGYSILRSTDQTNFTEVASLAAGTTSYTDANVTPGTTYSYQVLAYNVAGDSTPAAISIAIPLPTPELTAVAANNVAKVFLQWTDPVSDETGYAVQRSSDGLAYTTIASLPANTTTFADAGSLTPSSTYWYRIQPVGSATAVTSAPVTVTTAGFAVLDATVYQNKPNLSSTGMTPLPGVSGGQLYFVYSPIYDQQIDETAVRQAADRAAQYGNTLFLDVENWPLDIRVASQADVTATIARFTQVIQWIRSETPAMRIGIFGGFPLVDYASYYSDTVDPARLLALENANAFLQPLADQVDMVMPCLYNINTNGEMWTRFATFQIAQAHLYGKPVAPFIWNSYGSSGTPLPNEVLALELQVIRQQADGVAIWGGFTTSGTYLTWDETAGWWQTLQTMLGSTGTPSGTATNLSAQAQPDASIQLTWQNQASNNTGYAIERAIQGQAFVPIAVVSPGTTTYVDRDLWYQRYWATIGGTTPRVRDEQAYGMNYVYRVRTVGSADQVSNTVTIQPVRPAGQAIQAESFDGFGGDGISVTWQQFVQPGPGTTYLRYSNVDFGTGVSQFTAGLSTWAGSAGRTIEVHQDSPTGPLLGVLNVQYPGSYAVSAQSTSLSPATGIHDVYLVVPSGYTALIDWIEFT